MAVRFRFDPLITGIIVALIAGLLVPLPRGVLGVVSDLADVGVGAVFLVYGMRLRTREVFAGLTNIRVQSLVLGATYILFPILGFAAGRLLAPWLGEGFAVGFLFLSLLPSTIQSSVTFVSIARGNVGAAVCAATISNILGMFITPLLVLRLLNVGGADTGGLASVLTKLLLPFIIGQLLQPIVGEWWRAHKRVVKTIDTSSIVLIVFSATCSATASGAWAGISVWTLALLLALSAVLLGVMLALTWWGGKAAGLNREDNIVLLMCGSKKSLAPGLPMAKALFAPHVVGAIIVPVVVFHQLQLMVCAVIARRLRGVE
ncbi:bile acid:sodium symporter [Arcanobacterium haemolyticum]|nr:bile acid:sodium symporter [Arcanobacterium haemolyticum]